MYDIIVLKKIIENHDDNLIVIDHNGVILWSNALACTLFEYKPGELFGKPVHLLVPVFSQHTFEDLIYSKLITEANDAGTSALKSNGDVFQVRLVVNEVRRKLSPVYLATSKNAEIENTEKPQSTSEYARLEILVVQKASFLKDIIQILEQENEEVNFALIKQKEISQLKTSFVAMASHEFRTPLSSIQLSASLIEKYFDRLNKQKIMEHLAKIKSGVGTLTAIIDDFLSVEKIDAGKIKPFFKDFDLKILCEDAIESLRTHAAPSQEMIYTHQGETTIVKLDHNLLQHCLLNLISNALKYSGETAKIEVETQIFNNNWRVTVKDDGIGIPDEDQVYLFEPFFRAHNTTYIKGTGLGLSIVKRYAEIMGGHLTFKSKQNSGSTFTLTFPALN
ncbi:MAG: sensor histidine kinase [Mucilaginibacter sp.]